MSAASPAPRLVPDRLDRALEAIAAGAGRRDAEPMPAFPADAMTELERAGALAWGASPGARRPPAADELGLVRRVAAADGAVGRIFDGHLNGVERLAVQAPLGLREADLAAVAEGRIRVGVWGGDPVPGEGPPAAITEAGRREVIRGVKTFCSGAGGVERALVLARPAEGGPPVSAWLDVSDRDHVEVDESWFRGAGLRASVSHRVVFHDAPVLGRLGPPGSISEQPWFGRDALRTAASWAGMADSAAEAALSELAARPHGELEHLAAGRILTAQQTIGAWLERAAAAMDDRGPELPAVALHARVAIAGCCRSLLREAALACGSRPFARGGALERSRRDLELFLLQHRLDPLLARAGAAALEDG